MGSNAVHRTLHDLQRTRIGTRLFHRRNRQLTRRIPRAGRTSSSNVEQPHNRTASNQKYDFFIGITFLQTNYSSVFFSKIDNSIKSCKYFSHEKFPPKQPFRREANRNRSTILPKTVLIPRSPPPNAIRQGFRESAAYSAKEEFIFFILPIKRTHRKIVC